MYNCIECFGKSDREFLKELLYGETSNLLTVLNFKKNKKYKEVLRQIDAGIMDSESAKVLLEALKSAAMQARGGYVKVCNSLALRLADEIIKAAAEEQSAEVAPKEQ